MEPIACTQVRHFIAAMISAEGLALPSPQLAEHIAGCSTCRGALLLLLAAALPHLPAPPDTSCPTCQQDLAAFIDLEAQGSVAEAARLYPHVWWHLWVCPACAETYRLTRMLSEATQEGLLDPMPVGPAPSSQSARLLCNVRLERSFLHTTLAPREPVLGERRGSRAKRLVLAEEPCDGYQITLSVRRQADNNWCLFVTVIPPILGWLVLTLGEQAFRVRFDADSQSQVPDLPYALLAAHDGPDLVVGIELEDTEGDE